MISYYYKTLRAKSLDTLDTYQRGAWVNVTKPSLSEIDDLVKQFDVDRGRIRDALDPDEMPRLERDDRYAYVFVRYAYTNDELELSTAPLLIVVGDGLFMTVGLHPLPRLERFLSGKIALATNKPSHMAIAMLSEIADQYEVFINNISHQIKIIRSRLRDHSVATREFIDFVLIEDELNEFLSALAPTTAIIRRLMLGRHMSFDTKDHEQLEDLLLNNEQSIEGCKSNVKSIVNIRQAYATIASNNLNRTMKILTAATVMIALPTMFFSMYGMNVALPIMENPFAFMIMIFVSLFATILVAIAARYKRIF